MKKKLKVFCSLLLVVQMILSLAVMPEYSEGESITEVYQVPESPAVTYNMNMDWKFKKASDSATYPLASASASVEKGGKQFYEVGYDDSDWETVSVPHPINAIDSFDGNCYDSGESGLYRGFMFYRKNITIPQSDEGKKMFLEFEAVRQSVYLYVNGEMVGYYEAGITAMGFDITDYIIPGQENLIAVATDNASDRGQSDTTKVTHETRPGSAPGAADGAGYQWNTKDFNEVQGGITGNVNLYVKGDVYQTLPLYNNLKTTGNYIYATEFDIREKTAKITVEGEIRNESDAEKDVVLEVNIVEKIDPNADSTDENADHTKQPYLVHSFSSEESSVAVASDKGVVYKSMVPEDAYDENPAPTTTETADVTKITASSVASDLKFWSPDAPNLYDVYTILKDREGNILDVDMTTTGFRKVEYDINDGGLKINDAPVWLTGYAQRATNEWAVIGVANDWLQDFDMQWVKESNSNFIRWMHVAPKPSQIRSGDKYGVVSVCPAGDKEADVTGRAWDQRVEAMRDAMIYFRNSPSVLFWETGNNAITAEHQQEMTDLKAVLDPNGGRYSGCRTLSSVDQINATEFVGTMLNRHAGGAKGSMKTAGKYVPIIETEYAREEAPRRVWDDFSPPDYDYDNKWLGSGAAKQDGFDIHDLTSESFVVSNMGGYNEFYSDRVGGPSGNDYYTAAAIMVWSDSNMHNRNTASENCRTSGKVDAVRIKKQAFYAMQAAQSTTPKIHIVGHWNYPQLSEDTYNYAIKEYNGQYWEKTGEMGKRDPKRKTVYVIGSPDISKVELYVNDELVGTCTKPTNTFVYEFPNIDVTQSGKVSAKAYDAREQVVAEHEIKTAGEAVTIKLTPVTGPDGLIADGSDIAYFDLAVVDAEGNTCPLDYSKINLSVSGEGVLLGGYNSGVGDKITTNKDYVYAECGTNRIFVRSTRNAGALTLSAAFDGQPAVTSTIQSTAIEVEGGLSTQPQRSWEQGAIVEKITEEVVPLKALSSEFVADFSENGNTEIIDPMEDVDTYTMKINGTAIAGYTNIPYRPDTTTGVLADAIKTLEAVKAVKPELEYTVVTEGDVPTGYDGTLPMVSVTAGLKEGITKLDIINGSTTLFINNGEEKNLLNAQIEAKGDEVVVDIGAVLGYLDGVSYAMNENAKTGNIVVATGKDGVVLEYANGTARVTAISPLADANLIFASYENDALKAVEIKKINIENVGAFADVTPSASFEATDDVKVMLWASDMATPLANAEATKVEEVKTASTEGATLFYDEDYVKPEVEEEIVEDSSVKLLSDEFELFADNEEAGKVQPLDVLVDKVDYESGNLLTEISGTNGENTIVPATISDGAPDGTKYLTTGTYGNNKYGEYCTEGEFTYGGNTKEDIMIATDIKFNAEYAGLTPEDAGDKKIAGAIVLKGTTLQSQKTGSDYTNMGLAVDTNSWYHLALVGRYSAPDAAVKAYLWKYNEDGSKTYVGSADTALRNLAASNNSGVSHVNLLANTSVDNLSIYKLSADALSIESSSDTVKAGASMLFSYSATRVGDYITNPAVTWEVYNEANDAPLNNPEITISDGGLLTVGGNATKQKITVRATVKKAETDTESTAVYASKSINIDAIDTSTDTYDTLTLTTEGDKKTVRVNEPLTLTASASLDGTPLAEISDDDLFWYVYNAGNLRELGNDNITITDGVLSVTEGAIPQTVTVKAMNKSGSVSATYAVEVLPANMNTGNEDVFSDTFASGDACEEYVTGVTLEEGSWDGSGYYNLAASYDFVGFSSDTSESVIYSADMKFANNGAGWTIYNGGKGKLGLQLSSSGTVLNAIGASNKATKLMDIDTNAWYNIQVMCSTGGAAPYAIFIAYKYDENGNKVNPSTGEAGVPFVSKDIISLRNLYESTANHININAGTHVDNVQNIYIAPDKLEMTLDTDAILAGASAQASTVASRKGIAFPTLSSSLIKYEIYDAENKYPLGSDKITIDQSGKVTVDATVDAQEVYVRVSSTSGSMNDSKKLTIKSSDIFEVSKVGFEDEDYSVLSRIKVMMSFYYKDDVTFVAEVRDENGALKAIKTRKTYGDQLTLGENKIAMNMDMPEDFDKDTDTLRVYVVTKLATDKQTEGADLTVTSSAGNTEVASIPTFDASAKLAVLVLKPDADEMSITDNDIAYYTQIKASDITEGKITLPVSAEAGTVVKLAGNVGGMHTIAVGTVQ